MGWRDKYEFDWKFYVVASVIMAALGIGFHFVKRTIEISRGKDVQVLIDQVALDSQEHARQQARARVAGERQHYGLTDKEAKRLEDIYARAYLQHITIWRDDRMAGRSETETRRKQSEMWKDCDIERDNFLYSIKKDDSSR